ncbi:MAG: DUF2309 domain-containing protein [Rhodocyclaceae bacterium]|nr:DUF2309 domain-containing protein [Rhodocyclaceae bacterium]MDZ4214855.1 DUF2309 domain-containing protein [Rhodocyclaceae bacterium]
MSPTINVTDMRQRLEQRIAHLGHVLPGQASIRDFVHHNTLHGFQHLPFDEAINAAARLSGGSAWFPEDLCRTFYRNGRIDDSDLDAAMTQVARQMELDLDAVLMRSDARTVTRREVVRLRLLHPLNAISLARFRWLVEEQGVLRADAALWQACLDVLGIDHEFAHPEEMLELSAREEKQQIADAAGQEDYAEQAITLWGELRAKVGADWTAAALVRELTDEDALDTVRPVLIRHLGAHLDLGLAPWHNPLRGQGFYAAWKQSALHDPAWNIEGLPAAREEIARLPDNPLDVIMAALAQLELPEERWPTYLERLALELPGWSGMFLWREQHPGYADTSDVPVAIADYLAVRIVLERLVCADIVRRHWGVAFSLSGLGDYFRRHSAELRVRHAFHGGDLPEYLLDLIEPHLPAAGDTALPQPPGLWAWLADRIDAWRDTPTAERAISHGLTRSAWPLFQLVQQLGLTATELAGVGRGGADALIGGLRQLDANRRGYLWLLAYERHYREQILAGLAANHGRWRGHTTEGGVGPSAQIVFCMDDREEGMRRHLEEIAPAVETLGGAAHFAVFQNHVSLDDPTPVALCPVIPEVIVPSHTVHEVPREDEKVGSGGTALADRRKARRALRLGGFERLNQLTRRSLLAGPLLAALAAPFVLFGMLWRSLSPAAFGRFFVTRREAFDMPVATRLALNAAPDAGPATPQQPRDGFTDAEQAERIGNYLTSLGLTRNFAPLVVIMGHGSNSTNNPHMAAYDCGACAGRHSGPNARLFAAMANRPAVRTLLAARDIHVPEATWFLGAEHNTADDLITWYDLEDLPQASRPGFAGLDSELDQTARAHAQERCRRLFSAPLDIGQDAALRHVWGRRNDWSQARPELGHATNACAFVGRRAMSRGAFFDRRAFLISYDPTQDAEGKVLERHLLINGAVGAGISLEYFFSTANNEHFGCGSKITHNVSGYVGVMQGAASDLVTGLPRQMIEVHEAMRLLVVIEQTLELITAVYQRQPPLQELVGKGWVIVAAKDPDTGFIHIFDPALGWQPWEGKIDIPAVTQSTDWFSGKRDPLPPALLEKPLRWAAA